MTIQQQVSNDFLNARKSGDRATKDNLGLAFDALQKAAKELRKDELTDEEAITVLRKYDAQLKEEQAAFYSRRDFEKVNALHAAQEQLTKYIPALLEYDEVKQLVEVLVQGVNSKGEAMKVCMANLKGKADGKLINQVVSEFFK